MTLVRKLSAAAAVALALASAPALAADSSDPFFPPATEEQKRAAEEAHMKDVVRQMIPEAMNSLQQQINQQRQEIDRLNSRLASGPGQAQAAPGQPGSKKADDEAEIIKRSKFTACVNDKALYNDNGFTFFSEAPGPTGTNPCAQ